jgi:hypothetical protein
LKTGRGVTITGEALKTGRGVTITGELAILKTGGGVTITGEALKTGGGVTMTGELAANLLCAGKECVVGAATAVSADRARAEPIATHETFNHDEDILETLNGYNGTCDEG